MSAGQGPTSPVRAPPGAAVEQGHPEIPLERVQLGGQCRLADEQPGRRAPEVELLGERHERAHVLDPHPAPTVSRCRPQPSVVDLGRTSS